MSKWYIHHSGKWRMMMFKCNNFPTLTTYKSALEWHDNVVPMVRGYHKGKRPIHERSRAYWHIKMDGNDVVFSDNNTDIVRWKPDDTIEVKPLMFNCCYEQLTSLLDLQFFRKDNKLWVSTHITQPLHCNGVNVFKRDTSGHLQFVNPPTRTKKAINRIAAKKVRQRYKAFRDYVRQTHALRDEGYSYQECLEMFGIKEQAKQWANNQDYYWLEWGGNPDPKCYGQLTGAGCESFVEMIQDPEQFYRASLKLAYSANSSNRRWSNDNLTPTLKQMYEVLDRCLFYIHREEVFEDKKLEVGDTSRDSYAYLFA